MKNLILFRRDAVKKAFEAGERSALADPSNMQEAFEAGEKRGSAYLNEAVHAPNFFEFMRPRRTASPGSFSSWIARNEKKLSSTVDKGQFELLATEKAIEAKNGKKLISMDAIEYAVRFVMNHPIDELRYNRRRSDFAKIPRFFAWYLAYQHCHNTLAEMGARWGEKHYATVLHGARCVERDANLYADDMNTLTLMYRYLHKRGYDITHFVQDENVPSRSGNNRSIVKRVKIEI